MDKRNFNIGRDETCEIVINDSQGVVSRKHAILKALPFGRYEIIDVSKNGTFVNGKRLLPHKAVRVKRSDVITFANTYKMDWNDVPRQRSVAMIAAYCLVGLIVVILLIFGIKALVGGGGSDEFPTAESAVMQSEQREESPKAEEPNTSSAFGGTIDDEDNSETLITEESTTTASRQKRREETKSRQTSTPAQADKAKSAQTPETVKPEVKEPENNIDPTGSDQSETKKRKKGTGGD